MKGGPIFVTGASATNGVAIHTRTAVKRGVAAQYQINGSCWWLARERMEIIKICFFVASFFVFLHFLFVGDQSSIYILFSFRVSFDSCVDVVDVSFI